MESRQAVKIVGASGQISLGKKYAGQAVLIENIEEGVWLLKLARVIPDNELWMHAEPRKKQIDKAISWADENPPEQTDLESLSGRIP
ncbi:MAG: hypothetical protein ACP5IL_17150 [Syntrophobacteraceae bacterium]